MARQTRSQRRARRAQQAEQADTQSVSQRSRPRQQSVRTPVAAKAQPTARAESGGGARRFVAESWGELKKVEWPTQSQVIQGTVVVLVACAIVGVFLYANDLIWRRVVDAILGI